jgi:hypothetical protein
MIHGKRPLPDCRRQKLRFQRIKNGMAHFMADDVWACSGKHHPVGGRAVKEVEPAHTLNLEDEGILPESLTTPTAKCEEKMYEACFDLFESLQFPAA